MADDASRLDISSVGGSVLELSGELDSHTADALGRELHHLGSSSDVTLDLARVSFVDSSGLRVLIEAHQAHEEACTRLVLARPSDAVERLLAITGLLEHLHVDS